MKAVILEGDSVNPGDISWEPVTRRGPVVNEIELADALRKGKVAAFGADVISEEPMKADNPLYTAPNCYLTPHIAWATREARERLVDIAAANIKAFLEGKPINVVSG